MRIYQEIGNRQIISNYPELLKVSGIEYKGDTLYRAKDSLERMKGCTIVFNSCFFSKESENKIRETKEINLLSTLRIISIDEEVSKNYKEYFSKHANLKEIFIATLNEDIVKNLDKKIYKYFQIEDLTDIENATARKIFVMLTKWKHWQKENPIRRTSKFLASRIPLSWKPTNRPQTIKSLEKACEELKQLNKISNYKINRENGLSESTIDFFFEEKNNVLENINSKIGIEETGHEYLEINKVEEKKQRTLFDEVKEAEIIKEYSKEVMELYEMLPLNEKIEIRKDSIEKLLRQHSFEYLKSDIEYCKKKKPEEFWSYLIKSTKEGHFSTADIEKKNKKEEDKRRRQEKEEIEKKEKEAREKERDILVTELVKYITKDQVELMQSKYDKMKEVYMKTGVDFEKFLVEHIKANEKEFERLKKIKKLMEE